MANEVKIEQEQFEQLTDLLETVAGRLDEMASYLENISHYTAQTIDAVKAVGAAVEGADSDIMSMIEDTNRLLRQRR